MFGKTTATNVVHSATQQGNQLDFLRIGAKSKTVGVQGDVKRPAIEYVARREICAGGDEPVKNRWARIARGEMERRGASCVRLHRRITTRLQPFERRDISSVR